MKRLALVIVLCIAGCSAFDRTPATPDDALIRTAVRSRLLDDGFNDIGIEVSHGIVTLSGKLTNSTQREKALSDAETVDGVKRVINHIATP